MRKGWTEEEGWKVGEKERTNEPKSRREKDRARRTGRWDFWSWVEFSFLSDQSPVLQEVRIPPTETWSKLERGGEGEEGGQREKTNERLEAGREEREIGSMLAFGQRIFVIKRCIVYLRVGQWRCGPLFTSRRKFLFGPSLRCNGFVSIWLYVFANINRVNGKIDVVVFRGSESKKQTQRDFYIRCLENKRTKTKLFLLKAKRSTLVIFFA